MLGGQDFSEILAPEWLTLADAWAGYAADPNYVFNDLHAAMAFAKAEDQLLEIMASCAGNGVAGVFHSVPALFRGHSPDSAFAALDDLRAVMSLALELGEAGCASSAAQGQQELFQTGTRRRGRRVPWQDNPPVTCSALTPTHERGTEA